MPRGFKLSNDEKTKIDFFLEEGLSNRKIAEKLGRSHGVINSYAKKDQAYGSKKRYGRVSTISPRTKRQISYYASNNNVTAADIKAKLNLSVGVRRVRQILNDSHRFKWRKSNFKPSLKAHHINNRLAFGRNHMSWVQQWHNVIFSDEKKFNLDGPDACHYYWHDLRKEPMTMMSRNFGGGSVMVWAAFCYHGKSRLCFITGNMKSRNYIDMLQNDLIPFLNEMNEKSGQLSIFQQDNAPIHVSKETIQWLTTKNISLLSWPACSPDLNPIENLWGILVRRLYAHGRQFSSVDELKTTLIRIWKDLTQLELQNLIESMPNRIYELLKLNGKNTHY